MRNYNNAKHACYKKVINAKEKGKGHFTKSDITINCIVETRNGRRYFLTQRENDVHMLVDKDALSISMEDYRENLIHHYMPEYDIIKVLYCPSQFVAVATVISAIHNTLYSEIKDFEWTWTCDEGEDSVRRLKKNRVPEAMTIKEVENIFRDMDYPIKLVL